MKINSFQLYPPVNWINLHACVNVLRNLAAVGLLEYEISCVCDWITRKSYVVSKMEMVHPVGSMNVLSQFHGSLPNRYFLCASEQCTQKISISLLL